MKKIFYNSVLLFSLVSILMVSCMKEDDLAVGPIKSFISIEKLREMYKGEPLTLKASNPNEDLYISGVVISNPDHKNNPEGKMIIQNYDSEKLRGIAIAIDERLSRYKEGDSVIVKVQGGTLTRIDGLLQVIGLTMMQVGRISENNEQRLNIITDDFNDFFNMMDVYESTLIQLKDIQVLDVTRGKTFGDGDLNLSDGDEVLLVKTNVQASFAIYEVPISGNFMGIALYADNQEPYLSVRTSADYNGKYLAPENYIGFAEGWESIIGSRKTGQTTDGFDTYASGKWALEQTFSLNSATIVHKRETWAMLMGKTVASVAMDFDVMFGAKKFSFYYGAGTKNAGDAAPITVYAEYSQDSGATWILLGPPLLENNQNTQYFKEYDLDIKGKVRFRIRKDDAAARLIVDDIFIKPNAE